MQKFKLERCPLCDSFSVVNIGILSTATAWACNACEHVWHMPCSDCSRCQQYKDCGAKRAYNARITAKWSYSKFFGSYPLYTVEWGTRYEHFDRLRDAVYCAENAATWDWRS